MLNAWYYPNKYLYKLKCDIWYYIESLPLSRNLEQVMDIWFFLFRLYKICLNIRTDFFMNENGHKHYYCYTIITVERIHILVYQKLSKKGRWDVKHNQPTNQPSTWSKIVIQW